MADNNDIDVSLLLWHSDLLLSGRTLEMSAGKSDTWVNKFAALLRKDNTAVRETIRTEC